MDVTLSIRGTGRDRMRTGRRVARGEYRFFSQAPKEPMDHNSLNHLLSVEQLLLRLCVCNCKHIDSSMVAPAHTSSSAFSKNATFDILLC